ncbi:tyrosine-type recombinase/integrase [Pseudonocardia alni]|uniref:Phage integrase family protein n=2 Tax=Pseudonocardia alni TaxID=33907 RepID=A0AA44UV13_PSEA5|nr:site-specific integrase [Pseudonocardia alni]PKB41320.1 phage integrase family protein [Pseudonocardia alni]
MTGQRVASSLETARPPMRTSHKLRRHPELLDIEPMLGPLDSASSAEILMTLPTLAGWPPKHPHTGYGRGNAYLRAAEQILAWLQAHPGDGWQARWLASGADDSLGWLDALIAAHRCTPNKARNDLVGAVGFLLLGRVVVPSYGFLRALRAKAVLRRVRSQFRPDLFEQCATAASELATNTRAADDTLNVLSKIVLRTGRDLDQLTAQDLLTYRAWEVEYYGVGKGAVPLAWRVLRPIADLEPPSLHEALRLGQRTTAELIDTYQLRCRPVRDMLVRYFDERRTGMDYGSFRTLVLEVIRNFWSDIETYHPEIDSLHLPHDVAEAWRRRLRVIVTPDGGTRDRKSYYSNLLYVRAIYLDIQEWAHHDPYWAGWAAPNPVRRSDLRGMGKARVRTTSEMHQRVRDRLPHLDAIVDTAEQHRTTSAALLAAAEQTALGEHFTYDGRTYLRTAHQSYLTGRSRGESPPAVLVIDPDGQRIDLSRTEQEAFWAWAVIETLRQTGLRVEELSELTHLALISYRLPDSGEVVPMLQVVPSKSDRERLLLVSPELASVLASIITRLRALNQGAIPLTSRYDEHERVLGPVLPHLFQRRMAWRWEPLSSRSIRKLIRDTLERAGVRTLTGEPLRFTPHDFRRIFATEAANGGLPLHIVARLLGHASVNTTQAYTAVFDDELVRSYQAFLANRRAERPAAEHRVATDAEWREFQQHFQTRKLELGTCGRPYGTPCRHEHACIRCPSLRVDPRARPRLAAIVDNLRDRIQEARLNHWLGEIEGLTTSLTAAAEKLTRLDRASAGSAERVSLGMPLLTNPD